MVGVTELKNFLLNKNGKLVNNTTDIPWPRTQDLEALYEINHTMFLAKREVYTKLKNRLGEKVLLHVMDEIHSKDIRENFESTEILNYTFNNDTNTGEVTCNEIYSIGKGINVPKRQEFKNTYTFKKLSNGSLVLTDIKD